MRKGMNKRLMAALFLSAPACWAQAPGSSEPLKVEVKVVGKQESAEGYSYVVPGYTYSAYQSNPAWTGKGLTGYGTQTNGAAMSVPAQQHTYTVRGAMLSLQIPDGRIAVVNCAGKTNWGFHNPGQMKRSCRIPTDDVTVLKAEFGPTAILSGTEVRLSWKWEEKQLVSLNEAKMVTHKESETYKLIDVLVPAKPPAPAPKENP